MRTFEELKTIVTQYTTGPVVHSAAKELVDLCETYRRGWAAALRDDFGFPGQPLSYWLGRVDSETIQGPRPLSGADSNSA